MIFQGLITESEQVSWFEKTRKRGEEHYVYSHNGESVGLLSMKPQNVEGCFEAGVFCGEESFLGHPVNIHAVLWLYDYAFERRGMDTALAQVRLSNETALRLNKFIGYKEDLRESQGDDVVRLELSKGRYLEKRRTLLARL